MTYNDNWFICYRIAENKKQKLKFLLVTEMFLNNKGLGTYRQLLKNVYFTALVNGVRTIMAKVEKSNKKFKYVCKMHEKMGMIPYKENDFDKFYYIETFKLGKFV